MSVGSLLLPNRRAINIPFVVDRSLKSQPAGRGECIMTHCPRQNLFV